MSYSYLPINKVTRRRREYAKTLPDINRDRQFPLRSNEGEARVSQSYQQSFIEKSYRNIYFSDSTSGRTTSSAYPASEQENTIVDS